MPRRIISLPDGDVFRYLRKDDAEFQSFGEAYFSSVNYQAVKGWKRHTKMHMNIICVMGAVRFTFYDSCQSLFEPVARQVTLTSEKKQLLSVPPGPWFAFEGLCKCTNLICNISSIVHDESEVERKPLAEIPYPES